MMVVLTSFLERLDELPTARGVTKSQFFASNVESFFWKRTHMVWVDSRSSQECD